MRASVWLHRYINDRGDTAAPDLPMVPGERQSLRVLIFDNIQAANRARFGVAEAMKGQITSIFYREWTTRHLTDEQYRKAAASFQGIFDMVLVRETDPGRPIAPLFHERGLKAFSYQYLGALRRGSPEVTPTARATPAPRRRTATGCCSTSAGPRRARCL